MLAGDLSEEVDEAQSCGAKPPGEEEAYDADSESNPEEMAKQEEGRYTHTHTRTPVCTPHYASVYTHLAALLLLDVYFLSVQHF